MARRLERLETDQARFGAASVVLHSHNAQLKERLHSVTGGLCELRGALARSLDLCSLAVATAETVVEQAAVTVEAVAEEPVPAAEPVAQPPAALVPAEALEVEPEPVTA